MSPGTRRLLRRAGQVGGGLAGTAAVSAYVAHQVVRAQARAARGEIGKPLGELAHRADGVYKKSYGRPVRLLLLGDSIAAGLGAVSPADTLGAELASRLAKKTRRTVLLHTAAQVGAESSMLRAQLAGLPQDYRPDVAVVVVGGNDVTHRVRPSSSRRHLAETVDALHALGARVVVGTCPDLGALPALQQPLRTLVSRSSRQLAAAQLETAVERGAYAVALAQVVGPFFLAQPDAMFAIDRFHPSGAGYRRTAKALLPSVLTALGHGATLPFGHHPPR